MILLTLCLPVSTQNKIRDLKGEERPVQTQEDRSIIVSSARFVDAVIPQSLYDPTDILKDLVKVNILTKGDDWEYIPGQETIEELGGKLVKLGYTEEFSTSKLVSKMVRNE